MGNGGKSQAMLEDESILGKKLVKAAKKTTYKPTVAAIAYGLGATFTRL